MERERVISALLDTCVLFPLLLRDVLLDAAQAKVFLPLWSEQILVELRRNLISDRNLSDEQATGLVMAMRRHFPESAVTDYEALIPTIANHPKDRHVVAAAVTGRASVIVTSNLVDFPASALRPFGLVAQSPDRFLNSLFDLGAVRMERVLVNLAASYRAPAMSFEQLLDRLAKHAPTLVVRLREKVAQAKTEGA